MKKTGLLLVLTVLLTACTAKTAVKTEKPEDNTLPKSPTTGVAVGDHYAFYEKILLHPNFDQLKINSRLDIETGQYLPTLDVTTYIEKDKKVWMNLSAVFFNAARGIATPEGIKAYNRGDKTYIDSDFGYLNRLLNINLIDYKSLERLLLGRTFLKVNDSQYILSKDFKGYRLNTINNLTTVDSSGNTSEYKVFLSYNNTYDLQQVIIQDAKSSDNLQITYSDWQVFKNMRVPKYVKIIIKGSKNGQILLENTKFDDSKMATPYSVPASFTKIEIR